MRGRHLFSFIGRTTTFYVLLSGIPPSLALFYFDCVGFNLSWLDRIALRDLCVFSFSSTCFPPIYFLCWLEALEFTVSGWLWRPRRTATSVFLCVLNGGHEKGVDERELRMERGRSVDWKGDMA